MPVGRYPVPFDRDVAVELLRQMLRIRRFEEACAEQYGLGNIRGFLHLYIGQEAVAAGVVPLLGPEDSLVATYREHGHALVRGVAARSLMAEMFGRATGCCRGRGGSMHLFDAATRFYGGNAIVGGGLPLAVGLALAAKRSGRAGIVACFFGEGAMAEGAFHESANLAALWRVPALFVCENNRYAMGTALERSQARTDLCGHAAAYGLSTRSADGMDVVAVRETAEAAVTEVRAGTPCFLELQTYRFRAHSMFDPELYRERAEVEAWRARGPLHTYTDRLKAQGLYGEAEFLALDAEVAAEVRAAVAYAESAPTEPATELLRDVTVAA